MQWNARKTHTFKRHYWARAVISNLTPWKKVASIKKYIDLTGTDLIRFTKEVLVMARFGEPIKYYAAGSIP